MELASVLYERLPTHTGISNTCRCIHISGCPDLTIVFSHAWNHMKKWFMTGKWPWNELPQQVLAILSMWPSSSEL